MRSPRRLLSLTSSTAFGTLFLALSYACAEVVIVPTATDTQNDFAVSGILASSLWRVNGSQLTYAGTVTAHARLTQDKNGLHQDFGPATSTSDAFASSSSPTQRFGPFQLRAPLTDKSGSNDGAHVKWRAQFKTPRVKFKTNSGKDITIQMVPDPRGAGRPPVASMLFDGDRPASMIQSVYALDGTRWRPTRSRVTIFGENGLPVAVTESDLTALQTASVARPGREAELTDGFRRVGGSLSRLVRPDVLYAATLDSSEEGRCLVESLNVAGAAAAQLAADVALGAAIAACVGTIISCPAVVAASLTVAASAAFYLAKVIEWDRCMNPPPTIKTIAGGGGGGLPNGGNGEGCSEITWEISYDDGATWQYLSTQIVC